MTEYPSGRPAVPSTYRTASVTEDNVIRTRNRRLMPFAVAAAGIAFVVLALFARGTPYFPIDLEITRALQTVTSPWIVVPFTGLNAFGFPPIVTITFAAVVALLFFTGHRWEAISAGFATLGAAALTEIVKNLVLRPRPTPDLVNVAHHIESSGFPAGHPLNFTPFVGFLCYLAYVRLAPSWRRTALIAILMVAIAMMGPARIYDGEHWPSDTLGSYLLGFVWLMITIAFYQWGIRRKARESIGKSIPSPARV